MKFEYIGPIVTNEIVRMLLEKEVQGGILLKNKSVVSNTFVDTEDGTERPYKIESENSWYSHNLRYFAVHGGKIDESKGLAIVGFKDKVDIEQLQDCLRLRYNSLESYEFNKKAKLIEINWNHREMYTKDYRFNKKARKLILQLVKEGKLKGKIIVANGDTLDTDWRENEDRVYVGEWWYSLSNAQWQTSGERRKDYEFAGFTNSEDLKTLAEAYYG
jgi:hypothetical protein|nr:MAG TPA: hypothetical protein [Caudoviricetes sp.]